MALKFWNLRSKMRKSITLKNKNILVIERIQEKYDIPPSAAIERLIELSPFHNEILEELKEEYPDIE